MTQIGPDERRFTPATRMHTVAWEGGAEGAGKAGKAGGAGQAGRGADACGQGTAARVGGVRGYGRAIVV